MKAFKGFCLWIALGSNKISEPVSSSRDFSLAATHYDCVASVQDIPSNYTCGFCCFQS